MKRSSYVGTAGVLGSGVDGGVAPTYFLPQVRRAPLPYTITVEGLYRIYAWGSGGEGGVWTASPYQLIAAPGGSGSLCIADVPLSEGAVVAIDVPATNKSTTVVLPDGRTLVAGRGGNAIYQAGNGSYLPGIAGVAIGGDININGSAAAAVSYEMGVQTVPDGDGTNPGKGGVNGGRDDPTKVRHTGGPGAPGYDEFRGGDGTSFEFYNGKWEQQNRASSPGGAAAENQGYPGSALVILKRIG